MKNVENEKNAEIYRLNILLQGKYQENDVIEMHAI